MTMLTASAPLIALAIVGFVMYRAGLDYPKD